MLAQLRALNRPDAGGLGEGGLGRGWRARGRPARPAPSLEAQAPARHGRTGGAGPGRGSEAYVMDAFGALELRAVAVHTGSGCSWRSAWRSRAHHESR